MVENIWTLGWYTFIIHINMLSFYRCFWEYLSLGTRFNSEGPRFLLSSVVLRVDYRTQVFKVCGEMFASVLTKHPQFPLSAVPLCGQSFSCKHRVLSASSES
uniref:Uncharacterized protein n=1 Tax=Mus musculus TaxID=10090 RepID=Q3UXL7_MOUSE|nr:unnamed protein product [Mus musculus]